MKKNIILVVLLSLLLACQSAKQDLAKKVNLNTCEDTKELVEKYANTVLPLIGGIIVDKAIPESAKNGLLCECTAPSFETFFVETYSEKELDEMLTNRKKRLSAIKKAILGNGKTILKCYKDKGLKGVKWIEKFIKSIG
ncbi:MAG: hypothetical protein EAZ85_11970 [Bacteroidetes bacterium]|nr:MAG: hypothetical protein EAZ85_11970 [Bacteroidota bacterium]TAG93493.1 MAG: hypothetical protein EAZ20_01610 [Bacteroidota bacterium]